MIEYRRSLPIDEEVLNLLPKLEVPEEKILAHLRHGEMSAIKVFRDNVFCGVLIVRGEKNYQGELILVILHIIAANEIPEWFSEVLGESLQNWAFEHKFDWIRQHSDRPGLCRMLEKFYGGASEVVYTIRTDKEKCRITGQNLIKQAHKRLMTNETPPITAQSS